MKRVLSILSAFALLLTMAAAIALPAAASTTTALVNRYELVEGSYYYINGGGGETTSGNFLTSGYIPVTPGETLYLGPCVTTQGYQFATFSTAEPAGYKGQVAGSGMTLVDTLENGAVIYSYTVPSGINYIRMSASVDYARYFLLTRNQPFNKEGLMEYFAATAPVTNLYDKSTARAGYYNADHSVTTHASHYSAAEIAVAKDDIIFFGPANTAQSYQLYYWNSSDAATKVTATNANLKVVDTFNNGQVIYAYRAPDAGTVGVVNASSYNDFFVITKNSPLTVPSFYDYWDGRTDGGTYDTTTGRETASDVVDSVLNGKSALFAGDSICYGSQDEAKQSAWAGRIAKKYGLSLYTNNGVSGASLSTARAERQGRIVWQITQEASFQYDYVILHGGVNDAWDSYPVGKMTDSFDVEDFDVTTYAGALEELFYYAIKYHSESAIGYLINFKAPNCTHGRISDMSEYFAVGRQICEKWGIPYLDMYNSEEITAALKFTTKTYTNDYIHPTAAGYEVLYPFIAEWMETLQPYRAHVVTPHTETVIACVGDSITKGEQSSDVNRYSYPAQLQELLGDGYKVLNCGWGGATAQVDTSNPYKRTVQYKQSLQSDPNIVVVMLGTNDTKPANWDISNAAGSKAAFKADLLELVSGYQNLPTHPAVYMVTPAWGVGGVFDVVFDRGLLDAIREVSSELGCTLIDINAATKNKTDIYSSDNVHLNDNGYNYIAQRIMEGMGLQAVTPEAAPERPIEAYSETPLMRDFRFFPSATAYRLETVEDVEIFGDLIAAGNTFKGKTVYLMNDLDFTGIDFKPLGATTGQLAGSRTPLYERNFEGTFDGNFHTFSNVSIFSMWQGTALFPVTSGATIKNFGIASGRIEGYDVVGSIVAYGDYATQIINVWSAADVYAAAKSNINGSAGIASNMRRTGNATDGREATGYSRLENVAYYGNLSAVDCIGGLVAWGQSGGNALRAKNLIMGGKVETRSSPANFSTFIRYGGNVTGITENFYVAAGSEGRKTFVDNAYIPLTAASLATGEAAYRLNAESGAVWTLKDGYTAPWGDAATKTFKVLLDEAVCYTNSEGKLIQQAAADASAYWIANGAAITAEELKSYVFAADTAVLSTGVGDTDQDGKVDTADAVLLMRHLNGHDAAINQNNADINGDGGLTIFDVVSLLQMLAA